MIGWLLEYNIEFAKKFFGDIDLVKVNKVEREKYNFDLLVDVDGREYVIENKVKSLPNLEQILDYQEKANRLKKAKKMKSEVEFILLCLLEPGDEFKKIINLRIVSYEQIYEWVTETLLSDEYHKYLQRDYLTLLSSLFRIKSLASDFSGSVQFSFDVEDERILRSIRLFDIAQKIRYSCLAINCTKRLKELQLENLDNLMKPIEVGLSRSWGLMGIKVVFGENLLLGIQIQNNQYRLYVESIDKSDVQNLAERLRERELWLNPSDARQTKILKFGNIFKYVYCSIKGESGEDLVNRVVSDMSRLFRNRTKILDCLAHSAKQCPPSL